MSAPVAVMVFVRAPVPGACKTRLIPALGPTGAAVMHARLVQHALRTALDSAVGPVALWCAPDETHPFFARCAGTFGVALHAQCEGDLGARMAQAFEHAAGPALLMGSDAPCMTGADLRNCAATLAEHDAVFLPAEDGGYGLVGLRAPRPDIFADMTWSHARVMEETRLRMKAARLTWAETRIVWDVDVPADLGRLSGLLI